MFDDVHIAIAPSDASSLVPQKHAEKTAKD